MKKPVALFHPLSLTPPTEHNWCLWKNVSQLLWWDDSAANRLTGEEIRNKKAKRDVEDIRETTEEGQGGGL